MASSTSVFQPRRSAYRVYIRSRSPANSADSSPPSPDLISSRASLESAASRGTSRCRQPLLGGRAALASCSASAAKRLVLPRELAGRLEVVAEPAPLVVGPRRSRVSSAYRWPSRFASRLVGVDRGVGEPQLELGVLGQQAVDCFEHASPS